jgi:hypothetical protein
MNLLIQKGVTLLQIKCKGLLLSAVRCQNALFAWNTTSKKVKEINSGVKVVLMTSFEIRDNEFSKVFPSMHVDRFVQKPMVLKI